MFEIRVLCGKRKTGDKFSCPFPLGDIDCATLILTGRKD